MEGQNELVLNTATLIAAIKDYLNERFHFEIVIDEITLLPSDTTIHIKFSVAD